MSVAGARILITADAVGGVWQYATDLAHALVPLGVEPILAVLGPAPDGGQRALAEGLRVIETGLALDWLCDGPRPVRAAGRAIAELAADERADLVHLNMPTLAAATRFPVPAVAVAHGCVSTWWEAAHGTPLHPDFRWHAVETCTGLHAADRVVAPSAAYAATVARHYGLPAPPAVVHNGRRPLAGAPRARRDVAFTAGRLWDRVKNAAVLDRVAARLAIPFLAAGAVRGPHGETAAITDLQVLGVLSEADLAAQLASRPVFVSAARFEPFGLAVLEAAGAGCPLVLSDIPTFRELWDGAACFVPADDDAGFARAIEGMIGDDARREAMGAAARERAARYRPEAMAAGMARIYAGLIGAGMARAAA